MKIIIQADGKQKEIEPQLHDDFHSFQTKEQYFEVSNINLKTPCMTKIGFKLRLWEGIK